MTHTLGTWNNTQHTNTLGHSKGYLTLMYYIEIYSYGFYVFLLIVNYDVCNLPGKVYVICVLYGYSHNKRVISKVHA